MTDSKNKLKSAKDKLIGEIKETVGKVTGNEELELKGKIQSSKSDIREKGQEIKEDIAEKMNNIIDKKKDNIQDK